MKKRQLVLKKRVVSSSALNLSTIRYVECQKNHAASVGGYDVDGCREFMPCGGEGGTDGELAGCAACGFHRRKVDNEVVSEWSSPTSNGNHQTKCNMYQKVLITLLLLLSITAFHTSADEEYDEIDGLFTFLEALNNSNLLDFQYVGVVRPTHLHLNSMGLIGTFSPAITKLKYLVELELQDNKLGGYLPDLGNMPNLMILNLENNNFQGPIPDSWSQLTGLKRLVLSSNNLSGKIPGQLFAVLMFNFSGNHLNCGSNVQPSCTSLVSYDSSPAPDYTPSTAVATASQSSLYYWIIMVGVLVFVATVVAIFLVFKNCRRREIFEDVPGECESKIPDDQILRKFSLREIQLATNNFAEENIIGRGCSGRIYKGILSDNTKVAVKRLSDFQSPGGEDDFLREVRFINVAVHRNLLQLIGYSTSSTERTLIYPLKQNLSVAHHLRGLKPGQKGLDWQTRKRIALGAANALEYLHESCNPKILHRDLKTANIFRGTRGYIAPEYLRTGQSSEKTDIFGFGITLLELITGQRAIIPAQLVEEDDVLLLDHVKKTQERKEYR